MAETKDARLHRLEAAEEIRWLKAYYAQVCDDKYDAAHRLRPQDEIDAMVAPMVARVFAADAVWDASSAGAAPLRGQNAILARMRTSPWTFAMHYYVNPMIAVDGDTATARWMLWEPCTSGETGQAMWMSAINHDTYVRTAVGWQIQTYHVRYRFLTPFGAPWTGQT